MRIEISRDLPKRKTDFSWQKGISNCHAYLLRRSEVEEIMERSRLVEEEHPFVSGQGRTEVKVECRTNDVVLITVTAKEQTKETVSL